LEKIRGSISVPVTHAKNNPASILFTSSQERTCQAKVLSSQVRNEPCQYLSIREQANPSLCCSNLLHFKHEPLQFKLAWSDLSQILQKLANSYLNQINLGRIVKNGTFLLRFRLFLILSFHVSFRSLEGAPEEEPAQFCAWRSSLLRGDMEWEELAQGEPAWQALEKRMIADPSAPFKDDDAQERIGRLLAFALGVSFESEKRLFKRAAATLLMQCSGNVSGVEDSLRRLLETSWANWARRQNSAWALLVSIRREWERMKRLEDEETRKFVEGVFSELAEAFGLDYDSVAQLCLSDLFLLLDEFEKDEILEKFLALRNGPFMDWARKLGISPRTFLKKLREELVLEPKPKKRDWRVVE